MEETEGQNPSALSSYELEPPALVPPTLRSPSCALSDVGRGLAGRNLAEPGETLELQTPSEESCGRRVSTPGRTVWVGSRGSCASDPGLFPLHLPLAIPPLPTLSPISVSLPSSLPSETGLVPFGSPGSAPVGSRTKPERIMVASFPFQILRPGQVLRMHVGPRGWGLSGHFVTGCNSQFYRPRASEIPT